MRAKLGLGLLILCFLFSACTMPRAEVISAVKECEEAGMKAKFITDFSGHILDVQCFPVGPDK